MNTRECTTPGLAAGHLPRPPLNVLLLTVVFTSALLSSSCSLLTGLLSGGAASGGAAAAEGAAEGAAAGGAAAAEAAVEGGLAAGLELTSASSQASATKLPYMIETAAASATGLYGALNVPADAGPEPMRSLLDTRR